MLTDRRQTTDDRQQTTDKPIALPPAAHARTRGKNYKDSVEDLVEQMFHLWTGGQGKKPTSWGVLVTCLRSAKLNRLADDIESAYCTEEGRDGHKTTDEGNQEEQTPAPVTQRNRSLVDAPTQTYNWIVYTIGAIAVATCFIIIQYFKCTAAPLLVALGTGTAEFIF